MPESVVFNKLEGISNRLGLDCSKDEETRDVLLCTHQFNAVFVMRDVFNDVQQREHMFCISLHLNIVLAHACRQ